MNNNNEQIAKENTDVKENTETTTPPVQNIKKLKCSDCYFGVYGTCSCGESKFLNRVIFPWTKGCEMFRRS